MWITRSKFTALLTVSLIAGHSHSWAQCSDLSTGTKYKVLIDEVQYSAPGGGTPAVSLDLLKSSIEGALETVRQRLLKGATVLKGTSSMGDIEYLICAGRHPRDSEFNDSFMRSMVGNHAILEFWGTLFALDGGQHKFDVRYVMFPISSADKPRPSEFGKTEKTVAGKPTPTQITDFFINARSDLPAYFTVSAGLQKYADRQFPQAIRFLCEARTRLKKKGGQDDLTNFVDDAANKAGAELRQTLGSSASLLNDAQAKDYCKFATTR